MFKFLYEIKIPRVVPIVNLYSVFLQSMVEVYNDSTAIKATTFFNTLTLAIRASTYYSSPSRTHH